jgi:hypothetical protein
MGTVGTPLIAVKTESGMNRVFLECESEGGGHQGYGILRAGMVSNDEAIIEVLDHGEIDNTLICVNIGYIRKPFLIRSRGAEITVELVGIIVQPRNGFRPGLELVLAGHRAYPQLLHQA